VEYEIDGQNKTIRQIWSSETGDQEKVVSFAMGSVHWLPSQNILAGYGFVIHPEDLQKVTYQTMGRARTWTLVREFDHSTPARLLWELRLTSQDPDSQISWTLYGSRRIKRLVP
jgi:hypothetical protein